MAELNDLLVRGDSLLQGDAKINGKLNNHILNTDDNVLVIDVCRRLDVSIENNSIRIDIPDGYVAIPVVGSSYINIGWITYGSVATQWTTDAVITTSVVRADTSAVETSTTPINNYNTGTITPPVPFIKSYIELKVTTACTGATKPYCTIFTQIICHKE